MEYVSTNTTSVLVNGRQTDEFNLKEVCAKMNLYLNFSERLNIMLNETIKADMFSGYKIYEGNAVCISHLEFVIFTLTLILGEKSWPNIKTL